MTSSNTNNPICIFDSGVGGLTVFEKLQKLLPDEDYIYYGDTKNMPYGEKTSEQLLEYTDKIMEFFIQHTAKAVIMACNTTSAVVYEEIKNRYGFKVYPIIQSVASILAKLPIKKIGIFATPATIQSEVYAREISKHNPCMEIFEMSCPEWVKIVEKGETENPKSIENIKKQLDIMLAQKPEKIILGCTHYPYLMPILSKFAPAEMFIDPSQYFAEFIADDILKATDSSGSQQFFVSSQPENFMAAAKMFCELKDLPTCLEVNK